MRPGKALAEGVERTRSNVTENNSEGGECCNQQLRLAAVMAGVGRAHRNGTDRPCALQTTFVTDLPEKNPEGPRRETGNPCASGLISALTVPTSEQVREHCVAQLRLEPGAFGRHDSAGIGNVHQVFDAGREHRKSTGEFP